MSIVTDEAEDYANSQDYDCCQIIEGAFLGSASSFIDTGRAKDLARGMLDAARKAINRPATSQIQRTSMGLSGHMEYRHTMK